MKSLHRTEKKNGKLLGWSNGLKGHADGDALLDEERARWEILLPAYKYVLDECLQQEVEELRNMIQQGKRLVLLDTETNVNVYDYSRPVAASELLRRYLVNRWPSREKEEEEQLKKQAPIKEGKVNEEDDELAEDRGSKTPSQGGDTPSEASEDDNDEEDERDESEANLNSDMENGDSNEEEEEDQGSGQDDESEDHSTSTSPNGSDEEMDEDDRSDSDAEEDEDQEESENELDSDEEDVEEELEMGEGSSDKDE